MAFGKALPVSMGDTKIGEIFIDSQTGEFEGKFEPRFAEILEDGFHGNLIEVGIFAKAATPAQMMKAQSLLQEYLREKVLKVPLTMNGKEIGTAEVDIFTNQIKAEVTDEEALRFLRTTRDIMNYSIGEHKIEIQTRKKK